MSAISENHVRRKLRVLHVIPAFHPATYWGGPITATYGLCNALAATGRVELQVITTDAAGPRVSEKLTVGELPTRFPAGYDVRYFRRVLYTSVAPSLLLGIAKAIRTADLVHLSAIYSFPTIPTLGIARVFGKPIIWSLHGALQRWQDSRKLKTKWVWEHICSALLHSRKSVLHVTSFQEAQATRERIPNTQIRIIPFGVDIPDIVGPRMWLPEGRLRLLYMGRIDPIKGIANLLRAIRSLPVSSICLSIFGTGDEVHIRELQHSIQELGLQRQVSLHGYVQGQDKDSAFLNADVFILPSYSENFGVVVAEALAYGVPVIVSKGTPWSDVETRKCGLWVENDSDSLAQGITHMRRMDLRHMGENGRQWMREAFSWESVASHMIETYLELAV